MYQSNYIYWNLEVPDPKSILDFAEAKPSSTPAQTAGEFELAMEVLKKSE